MTQTAGGMSIVGARDLVPEAPADLKALHIRVRTPEGQTRRLCAAGDLGPASHLLEGGDPFREIAPVLKAADVAFANLETPLLHDLEPASGDQKGPEKVRFAAPAKVAEWLADAGFGLLHLANNHILDFGAAGLAETRATLTANDIPTLGAGVDADAARRLEITELGDLKLGWLGCARTLQAQDPEGYVFWEYDPEEISRAIRQARPAVDVLIVSLHMGYMYVDYPHPEQRQQVLELLDAGADLVLMHHAHVLQGIEVTDSGIICYNLGNLLLDWTLGDIRIEIMQEEQRSGGLFILDLDRGGVCSLTVLPIRVDDDWTIRWASGDVGRTILERLRHISDDWDGDAARYFHRQLADRATGLAVHSTLLELRQGGLKSLPGLLRRIKGHHLRMIAGWPAQRLKRWLSRGST